MVCMAQCSHSLADFVLLNGLIVGLACLRFVVLYQRAEKVQKTDTLMCKCSHNICKATIMRSDADDTVHKLFSSRLQVAS